MAIQAAVNAGVYEILDNLDFTEFDSEPNDMRSRRVRWVAPRAGSLPARGQFTWHVTSYTTSCDRPLTAICQSPLDHAHTSDSYFTNRYPSRLDSPSVAYCRHRSLVICIRTNVLIKQLIDYWLFAKVANRIENYVVSCSSLCGPSYITSCRQVYLNMNIPLKLLRIAV